MVGEEVKGFKDVLAHLHVGPLVPRTPLTHCTICIEEINALSTDTMEPFPGLSSFKTGDGFLADSVYFSSLQQIYLHDCLMFLSSGPKGKK